jgi:ABC-type phosphate transport system substrate-binding protein
VVPGPAALAAGSYPLRHTYFLITAGEPSPIASSFVDFVLSEPGRKILAETGHSVPDRRPAR